MHYCRVCGRLISVKWGQRPVCPECRAAEEAAEAIETAKTAEVEE